MHIKEKMSPALRNLLKGLTITAGAFTAVISLEMLTPIKSYAAEERIVTEEEYALSESMPEIITEDKLFWKDNELHPQMTDETCKELALWVTGLSIQEEKIFPNIPPELLEAQWIKESTCFTDATNGNGGTGDCVGISQSSCKWNMDLVKKWCYVVGEDASLIESKEDARRILIEYPEVNALVQASQLQKYYNQCPQAYSDNPLKYALTIYRWGNITDGQVEYDGTNHYADSLLEKAKGLEQEYKEYAKGLEEKEKFRNINCFYEKFGVGTFNVNGMVKKAEENRDIAQVENETNIPIKELF